MKQPDVCKGCRYWQDVRHNCFWVDLTVLAITGITISSCRKHNTSEAS